MEELIGALWEEELKRDHLGLVGVKGAGTSHEGLKENGKGGWMGRHAACEM